MRSLGILFLTLCIWGCSASKEKRAIDLQGHRGARGLFPENSIDAFLKAAEMGVNTLELDLVVSKDGKLVVSHEPYFSTHFCLDTLGNEIPEDSVINIYQLSYDVIKQFDCGSKGNPRFPEQERSLSVKPLLEEVLDTVEAYIAKSGRSPVFYNIELKTTQETDFTFHPSPEAFSDLVYELITRKNLWNRVNIQSFDFRTLQYYRKTYPEVVLALLIENELPWKANTDSLGFIPEIYSCYFPLLDKEVVKELQNEGMKVIPWTVNEPSDLNQMLELEVDGIITDYPDRAITILDK